MYGVFFLNTSKGYSGSDMYGIFIYSMSGATFILEFLAPVPPVLLTKYGDC